MVDQDKIISESTEMQPSDELVEGGSDRTLLHGVTLGEEDPTLGALLASSRELGTLSGFLQQLRPGAELDLVELGAQTEGMRRRLEVAIELYRRGRRAPAS